MAFKNLKQRIRKKKLKKIIPNVISPKEKIMIFIALSVFVFDRITKVIVKEFLNDGRKIDLYLFDLRYTTNTGSAFSILKDHNLLLTILGIVAFFLLIYLFRKTSKKPSMLFAKGLIFGGALGNLLDRLFVGQVIDFIDFRFWPIFNVADIALTLGVIIIIYQLIRKK